MPRVLILAYGNPLRSDDGLAWRAAEILRGRIVPSEVEILSLHQLAPELAEDVSRVQAVIFVDSAQPAVGRTAGEIQVREVASGPGDPTHSSHSMSPQTLIALASRLYGAAPRAFCVTLTGSDFGHSESLSPAVAAALPDLISRLESLIQFLLG